MISVDGAAQTAAAMAAAAAKAPKKADEAVDKVARKVEQTARGMVPRRTGALAGSINTKKEGEASRSVGSELRYARFVEYGTYKDAPQPYLFPAASRHSGELAKELGKAVADL